MELERHTRPVEHPPDSHRFSSKFGTVRNPTHLNSISSNNPDHSHIFSKLDTYKQKNYQAAEEGFQRYYLDQLYLDNKNPEFISQIKQRISN